MKKKILLISFVLFTLLVAALIPALAVDSGEIVTIGPDGNVTGPNADAPAPDPIMVNGEEFVNDPRTNPQANACYEGGSMAGKCDTQDADGDGDVDDADRGWMWAAGWHLIKFEYGMATRAEIAFFASILPAEYQAVIVIQPGDDNHGADHSPPSVGQAGAVVIIDDCQKCDYIDLIGNDKPNFDDLISIDDLIISIDDAINDDNLNNDNVLEP